jgi:hypothetical protein
MMTSMTPCTANVLTGTLCIGIVRNAELARRNFEQQQGNINRLQERFNVGERPQLQLLHMQQHHTRQPASSLGLHGQPASSYGLRVLDEPARLERVEQARRAEQQVAQRLGITTRAVQALDDDAVELIQRHRDGDNGVI